MAYDILHLTAQWCETVQCMYVFKTCFAGRFPTYIRTVHSQLQHLHYSFSFIGKFVRWSYYAITGSSESYSMHASLAQAPAATRQLFAFSLKLSSGSADTLDARSILE